MRTKVAAVLISSLGCFALLGCNTEAGYRDDAARDDAALEDSARTDTQRPAEAPAPVDSYADANQPMTELGAYDAWDADQSGDVSKTEFDSKFASAAVWSDWDKNLDQSLDRTEAEAVKWFAAKNFTEMDPDADDKLSRTEAGEALWATFDVNGDSKLDRGEWKG